MKKVFNCLRDTFVFIITCSPFDPRYAFLHYHISISCNLLARPFFDYTSNYPNPALPVYRILLHVRFFLTNPRWPDHFPTMRRILAFDELMLIGVSTEPIITAWIEIWPDTGISPDIMVPASTGLTDHGSTVAQGRIRSSRITYCRIVSDFMKNFNTKTH